MKIQIVILFLILFINKTNGQNTFNNDICIPETLYMLEGVQNDIFVEPLIKRWRPYNDVVRFSGSADYSRALQRVASIITPIDGQEVRLNLTNQDEFKTIKSVLAKVIVGKPNIGNDTIAVSITYRDIDDYPSIAKNMENQMEAWKQSVLKSLTGQDYEKYNKSNSK